MIREEKKIIVTALFTIKKKMKRTVSILFRKWVKIPRIIISIRIIIGGNRRFEKSSKGL